MIKNLMLASIFMFGTFFLSAQSRTTNETNAVRAERKVAITSESGWRSLSGLGLNVSYYPTPKVAIDAGAGFGFQLVKLGLRGRYLFSTKNFSPYIGAGILYAPLSAEGLVIEDPDNFEEYTIDLSPSAYGQFILGLEFTTDGGFVLGFNMGYAHLLTTDNIDDNGVPLSNNLQNAMNLLYGSSIVIAGNIGFAF